MVFITGSDPTCAMALIEFRLDERGLSTRSEIRPLSKQI